MVMFFFKLKQTGYHKMNSVFSLLGSLKLMKLWKYEFLTKNSEQHINQSFTSIKMSSRLVFLIKNLIRVYECLELKEEGLTL